MPVPPSLSRLTRRVARLDREAWLEAAARLGHAARAAVYLAVGGFVFSALANGPSEAEGASGVLEALASWALGQVWLVMLAAGLFGFAGWRFVQAGFNAERHPDSLVGWGARAGEAVSGLVYGALGWSALSLLEGLDDLGESDQEAQQTAQAVLALPFGQVLLGAAGLAVAAVGAGHLWRALTTDFCDRMRCRAELEDRIRAAGRAGYAARAAGFLLIGFYVLQAAWTAEPQRVATLEGVLENLLGGTWGAWAAAAVGAGFVAFGLFGLAEARYRRIRVPQPLASD